jgi:hypothetical protein
MGDRQDILRETFRTASDKDLVHLASRRAMEQSIILQLDSVPADVGIAMGIEFLLREPLPGEEPEDAKDPTLDAMRDELRIRVAKRFGSRSDNNG